MDKANYERERMTQTTPLPCPWCKEVPTVEPIDWAAEGDAWGAVSCENDDCLVKPSLKNWANIRAHGASGSRQQQRIAVRLWNKPLSLGKSAQ